jgi:lysophospholipase L1-like esterase
VCSSDLAPSAGTGAPLNLNLPRPYNNMAVPGARLHDLLTLTTDNGGLHDLILRRQGASQLAQGLSLRPTFVTLWIGNNDALGAATRGIVNDQTLTPAATFEAEYKAVTDAIAASGAKMAIANIPNVTSIPFVNTLSRFLVNPATNQPVLVGGAPVPLIGPDGPLAAGDFVLLSATTELAQGRGIPAALGGSGLPLSDGVVLNSFEAGVIRDRIAQYNAVISAVATAKGAALVDANAAFNQIAAGGINVGGLTYTAAFLTGGIFSYDGVQDRKSVV